MITVTKQDIDSRRWASLEASLPVRVRVAHNYTSARHTAGHVQGADHILTLDGFTVGRLHRDANRPLCWTPSNARNLRVFSDPGDPAFTVPTCKTCLAVARRLAGK